MLRFGPVVEVIGAKVSGGGLSLAHGPIWGAQESRVRLTDGFARTKNTPTSLPPAPPRFSCRYAPDDPARRMTPKLRTGSRREGYLRSRARLASSLPRFVGEVPERSNGAVSKCASPRPVPSRQVARCQVFYGFRRFRRGSPSYLV
jgi:hypothetical protein